MSNYAKIKNFDIADATGISVAVFLSGCDAKPKCKGCFNSSIWDKNSGIEITDAFYEEVKQYLSNKHIQNLVLLGGDPLAEWNLEATCNLINIACMLHKKIWVYTWRPFEVICQYKDIGIKDAMNMFDKNKLPYYYNTIINNIDVLVDGRFIEEQKDLTLPFCGSRNQRVIDVKKTLEQQSVVLYDDSN